MNTAPIPPDDDFDDSLDAQEVDADEQASFEYTPAKFDEAVRAAEVSLDRGGHVYSNGSMLVRVVGASDREQEQSAWRDAEGRTRYGVVAGSKRILPISAAVLRQLIARRLQFMKYMRREKEWAAMLPPAEVVSALHEAGSWDLFTLRAVSESPILRPDGTIAQTRGFDRQSGYYIDPNATFPTIPDHPTSEDARRAYAALAEVFADFPFDRDDASCVAIAAILTILARPAIHGSVPGFEFDASAGGTGKTLQTDAISIIATGRPASRKAYPKDDEETDKVFAGYALRGAPLISIDDVKRPLGGEVLDMLLTCLDAYDFRILGRTETVTLPWRAVLLFTGINITHLGQMNRRLCVARIESPLECPQNRNDFQHPLLLDWVRTERPRLAAAALTILRAYTAAGRPDLDCGTWGSFEPFARFIPNAIRFAAGPNLLDFRPPDTASNEDADQDYIYVAGLQALCLAKSRPDGMTAEELVTELFDHSPPAACVPLREALREAKHLSAGAKPSPRAVSRLLSKRRGKPVRVGGKLMKLFYDDDDHARGRRWGAWEVGQ